MSTGSYRQPVYLTDNDHPRHRIRCPIHGFIRFSENERAIIDHPLFRRLRWIRQLALTELVYPGATHTRFEHSLGVMEVATRIFDVLAQSNGQLMEDTFKTVEGLKDNPLGKARQLVRLAALLHDSGHCCFSHAAESVIHKDADHETLTILMLETPDLLGDLLDGQFFLGAGKLTAQIIAGSKKSLPPQMQVLKDIVSGQVDADRTDYLLRDSYHCGVDYGRFDYRRMIECLTLRADPAESGGLEIAMKRDGIHTFEALILARYQMNTQVYYHRLRRIYDHYLNQYFKALDRTRFDSPDKILGHNDFTMMTEIIADANDSSLPQHKWAKRIRDRHHHREVYATDEDAGAQMTKKAHDVYVKIKSEYSEIDFVWEVPNKPVSTHKLLLEDDATADSWVPFSVIGSDGSSELISVRSPILRKIPRWFQVARIYADVERSNKSLRSEIAQKCKNYAKF